MREQIKIRKVEYVAKNARILGIAINGAGIHITMQPIASKDVLLTLPVRADARFHLLTEDGNEIGLVKEPLAKWLTEKA